MHDMVRRPSPFLSLCIGCLRTLDDGLGKELCPAMWSRQIITKAEASNHPHDLSK